VAVWALGKSAILLDKVHPSLRKIFFGVNRGYRADRHTSATVDALIGVNVELITPIVDAFDRADLLAAAVFDPDARLSDHVGHRQPP
jgi:hypothetical protein